jgi:hypothetical protein
LKVQSIFWLTAFRIWISMTGALPKLKTAHAKARRRKENGKRMHIIEEIGIHSSVFHNPNKVIRLLTG